MKKINLLTLSLMVAGMGYGSLDMAAQSEGLSIAPFTIKAGETMTVKVNKADIAPTDYTGFQLDITAPVGLTIDNVTANTGYPENFKFVQADNTDGSKTIILASAPSGQSIPTTNITEGILEITVTASKTVTDKATGDIKLTNIIFTGTEVNNLKTSYADATCTVTYENVPAKEVEITPGTDPTDPDDPYDPETDPDPDKPNPNDPDYPKHENWGENGYYEIYVDETIVFGASVDEDATLQDITWTPTASTTDLQVSVEGNSLKITGLQISETETTFTAASEYADVKTEIKVKVVPMPVMRVYINSDNDKNDVDIDGTLQLSATVYPAAKYTGDVTLTWSIDEEDYASIDSSTGEVTGIAPGDATVTVSAQGEAGDAKTKTLGVTVNPIKAEKVEITTKYDKIEGKTKIKVGEKLKLTAIVTPEETSFPEVEWTVSEGDVVSLTEDDEIIVTALKEGTATVTATVKSSNDDETPVAATIQITVEGTPLYGDADDSGKVDIVDAMTVAYYIIDMVADNFCFINADVIQDENIDIADYNEILDISAGISLNYKDNEYVGSSFSYTSDDRLMAEDFTVGDEGDVEIGLSLENTGDYKGLQADIIIPEGMTVLGVEAGEAAANHSLLYNVNNEGTLKVVLLSAAGESFKAVDAPLFTINAIAEVGCGDLEIENVIALDNSSNKYELGSEAGTNLSSSAVKGIRTESSSVISGKGYIELSGNSGDEVTVYDLDGRIVKNETLTGVNATIALQKGIYLVRIGRHTERVAVK